MPSPGPVPSRALSVTVVPRDLVSHLLLAAALATTSGCGGGGGGGSGAPGSGPPASGVTLRVDPVEAPEKSGELRFIVRAAFGDTVGKVSFEYAVEAGTAGADVDFEPASGRLQMEREAGGASTVERRVLVTLRDDELDEDDEVIRLLLENPTNARLAVPGADGRIIDDDPEPSLTAGDAEFTEGSAAAAFVIALSAPSGREVSVSYATKDGSARAGRDYTPVTGTAVFLPGDREKTVPVQISDD